MKAIIVAALGLFTSVTWAGIIPFNDGDFTQGTPAKYATTGASGLASNWVASITTSGDFGFVSLATVETYIENGKGFARFNGSAGLLGNRVTANLDHGNILRFAENQVYRVHFSVASPTLANLGTNKFGIVLYDSSGHQIGSKVGAELIASLRPLDSGFQEGYIEFNTIHDIPSGELGIRLFAESPQSGSYTVTFGKIWIEAFARNGDGLPQVQVSPLTRVGRNIVILSGSVSGPVDVAQVLIRTKRGRKVSRWIPVSGGMLWSKKIRIKPGKRVIARIKAIDAYGNVSGIRKIVISKGRRHVNR
jgi:hypothetical protein